MADQGAGNAKQHRDDLEEEKLVETSELALVPIPADAIPVEIALPCSLYIKIGDRFPRFRGQGEKLTVRRIIDLTGKGAKTLYIHRRVWTHFMEALEKTQDFSENPHERAGQLRSLIVAYGTELERKLKEPKKPMFERLRKLSESLAMAIRQEPTVGGAILRKDSDPGVYFVNHSVNCAVYACVIGFKLNYSVEDLKLLTYAALVHDVGNLFLPKELLYKTGDLSEDERQLMNTHARRGAELLHSFGSPAPVVLAALQHHERMDGKGYPASLSGDAIHNFARICSVADTYDALTSNKPYQKAMTPVEAIGIMRSISGKFDPKILGMVAGETKIT